MCHDPPKFIELEFIVFNDMIVAGGAYGRSLELDKNLRVLEGT